MNEFLHTVIDIDKNGDLIKIGKKALYNIDQTISARDWSESSVKGKADCFPTFSTAIVVKENGIGTMYKNAFGYFYNNCNNVGGNSQKTGIFSMPFSGGMGYSIFQDNFKQVCSLFSARRLVACDWINNQDQYMKPNVEDPRYKEFETDALVYSLFESKSQQSSLRKVEYKGREWDVKNEFFWMTAKEMAELADAEGLDETYNEASTSPDRHMAKLLSQAALSGEAKAVLEKAKELVHKSMKYRRFFDEDNPNYQILNWDAGWYQVKAVLKAYMPKELEEFKTLYKRLGDRMRPMVYSLGFLKK